MHDEPETTLHEGVHFTMSGSSPFGQTPAGFFRQEKSKKLDGEFEFSFQYFLHRNKFNQ
jgi:hypothetical protein